jgi:two-component system LytT family sensor kinase
MILQPLVENALRHGIAPKIEGGTITLRSRRGGGRLIVEIADDGVGISGNKPSAHQGGGIGISNVQERLKVVYGQDYTMKIDSQPGKGTCIRIEIPELITKLPAPPMEQVSANSA